jgi:hypothetical protein
MGKHCELPVTERREAILSLLRRKELGVVITRHYGVSEASPYRWHDAFLAGGEVALAGGTRNGATTHNRDIAEFEQQIGKRDQVIGELTVANRI